jgi:hypothetical protein
MLLRGSEDRTLTVIGAVVVLCAVLTGFAFAWNPFGGRPSGRISVTIDTPYIGQGVKKGTVLVMHGVKVGEVTNVASLRDGGVRLVSELQKTPVSGLTDTMNIDFRPINYFGVTAVNIIATPGGQPLRDGMQIHTVPRGNFALQALLSRLGEVSVGTLTPQLISTIDRAARYTDALNPLIETMLTALQTVANVQTVPTAQLLANSTGVGVAFPSFADSVVYGSDRFLASGLGKLSEDFYRNKVRKFSEIASTQLFGSIGRLETKYIDDLLPAIDGIKALTDPIPALIRPDDYRQTLVELRTRYEKMFAGPPDQRALQVRIVLDSLPGVAAPLQAMGGQ